MRYLSDLALAFSLAYHFDSYYELADTPYTPPQSEAKLANSDDFADTFDLCPA